MERSPGRIPLSEPALDGREWEYVKDCIDSGWVSSAGSYVTRFEEAIAERVGGRHVVATSSGTAALHLALVVAGVKEGDLVLVSDLSFIAPANAIRYAGAFPVFVDPHPDTWQMDTERIEDFLRSRSRSEGSGTIDTSTGRRIAAILPVDILGHPVDMDEILGLAEGHDLQVVDDATESLGARYRFLPVGSSAPFACLSFNGNKIITTGGGGAVVTSSAELADEIRYLATQAKDDPIRYVHKKIGFNYRLSNVAAAIGCAQLERLDEHVSAKRRIAETYKEGLADLPRVAFMPEQDWATATYWLSTILADSPDLAEGLLAGLHNRGVEARPLWQPLHESEAHPGAEYLGNGVSSDIAARSVSLPSSVGLERAEQEMVIDIVRSVAR
jgi:perosamine synthetase